MKSFYCVGAVAALALSSPAFASDYSGGRVEARLGYETPTVSGDGDVYKIGSAVSYGGEVGYDIAAGGNWTVGPYGTLEFSSVKDCEGGFCLKVGRNVAAGLRVGYGFSGKYIVYGKLGYANIKLTADDGISSDSESKGGVQGALGFEGAIGKNAYWGAEVNYGDYGKLEGINLQRRHVAAKVGYRF